nr:F-box/FBD/LRR-repeat protein At1g13570-like [Ipomoea batatas]
MARCRRLKTLPDASRDLISELPVEVKDMILEYLPTRDAARTALLSRHWNHVWLQHERLTFDCEFVQSFQQSQDDDGRTLVNIINNILFTRAGPVKKFTLEIDTEKDPLASPQQSDFDRWCLFLSRNGVDELNLSLYSDRGQDYQLPFCLLSCRTVKKLIVEGPFINLPLNACDIFSSVTSLAFLNVVFHRSVNAVSGLGSDTKCCKGIHKKEEQKEEQGKSLSELPVEVKDRILECLPTQDAARTALLSRHWNHVWLQHERLTFGCEFMQSFQHSQDDEGRTLVNIINNILFSRAGPVKKFTLEIDTAYDPSPSAQQSDFDRWCLFLSTNGVEELNLSLYSYLGPDYQLPFCLLSCKTIKQLIVEALLIDLPVNAVGLSNNFSTLVKRSPPMLHSSLTPPLMETPASVDPDMLPECPRRIPPFLSVWIVG